MVGLGGSKKTSTTKAAATSTPNPSVIGGVTKAQAGGASVSSGGFIDDNVRRMPSSSDAIYAENLRRLRSALTSRSGRVSTDLTGTRSYINNFLGSTY